MILQPRGHRVIVRRKIIGRKGSLYVPANSQEMKFSLGTIAMLGPDCDEDLRVGDLVTFGRYAPLNLDRFEMEAAGLPEPPQDEEYLLMNDEDILCHVVEEDAEVKEEQDAA